MKIKITSEHQEIIKAVFYYTLDIGDRTMQIELVISDEEGLIEWQCDNTASQQMFDAMTDEEKEELEDFISDLPN